MTTEERQKKIEHLQRWVQEVTPKTPNILIPISGGSDSALAFWLYNSVYPERTAGVYFGSKIRAEDWFKSVGDVRYREMRAYLEDPDIMRFAECLELCLKEVRVLISTRNKTENVLGTYSLVSRIAFHIPLIGLWKSEILELCEHVGVPEEITVSSKKADPVCGRPEELVAMNFDLVDRFLAMKIGEIPEEKIEGLMPEQIQYLEGLFQKNRFKLNLPVLGIS